MRTDIPSGRPASLRSLNRAAGTVRQPHQAVGFIFNHGITLARQPFQTVPVQHSDPPSIVADDACSLQLPRRLRHTFAAYAQHVRNELLRHGQLVGRQPVEGKQQPSAELLIDRMMPIANCSLRHLRDQCLHISQQQDAKLTVTTELLLDTRAAQAKRAGGALHDGTAGSGFPPP